jgi:amino acid adenylation domain-containing protein
MTESNIRTGFEIAVIGMAGRFPGADTISEFWKNLRTGVESVTFFSRQELQRTGLSSEALDNPNYVASNGVTLQGKKYFDAAFFEYTPRESEVMDPQMRILHEVAWTALEDGGYNTRSYDGLIGLYAGAASSFDWKARSLLSGRSAELGGFTTMQLHDVDYLVTRISYKLNLQGPAVSVQTACSTSLVAVHMACRALLSGECSMALAGGITISTGEPQGYPYNEGMIMSPDGHCRAFDKDAKGTFVSEGVGLVLLKSLEEALEDRDHIYAVIKSTAINNDGIRKIGFTAPSIEGQAKVIQAALHMAEVEPETISYVETHGTGTILGDPIEFEALKLSFDSDKRGFCALGSVKTNIGHLDRASGIAGFIKAVLSLNHRLIPPSLHFQAPNPKIDLENSPFYVNTNAQEWINPDAPLRAGVSSFGIGGTNAHAILEEAPQPKPRETNHDPMDHQLLVLSARTQENLQQMTLRFKEFLEQNPGIHLGDVAYTLHVGRESFPARRMMVCSHIEEAIQALTSLEDPGVSSSRTIKSALLKDQDPPVVFMFSGLGPQYVNMGLELYQKEPGFCHHMDRCFDILRLSLDYDLKDLIYPGFSGQDPEEATRLILDTDISQLVMFVFQYALARLLMDWGIKPEMMIGYSFGEYAAACISGVFSLEDALQLIVKRGRLIRDLPNGAMLSVPVTPEQLTPLLLDEPDISFAIDNGSSCIVSGTLEAIHNFEARMKQQRLICMRLAATHAIHSRMMDPILQSFASTLENVRFNKANIPFMSNVTRRLVSEMEASEPQYWVNQLRQTVRFAEGMQQLVAEPNALFIEIGPGRDLTALMGRHIESNPDLKVINLIPPQERPLPAAKYLLNKIGQLWLSGQTIDWSAFHAQHKYRRLPLPTYPFSGDRYWMDQSITSMAAKLMAQGSPLSRKSNIAEWFYTPSWKQTLAPRFLPVSDAPNQKEAWLVLDDRQGLGQCLSRLLKEQGQAVFLVNASETPLADLREEDGGFTLDPRQPRHYDALIKRLLALDSVPLKIVHMWTVPPLDIDHTINTKDQFDSYQHKSYYSLLFLVQALAVNQLALSGEDVGSFSTPIDIAVVSSQSYTLLPQEGNCPLKLPIHGLSKAIPQEYVNLTCRSIDVPLNSVVESLSQQLLEELQQPHRDNVVALRHTMRWVQCFEPLVLERPEAIPPLLKQGGVYLITGGLGKDSLHRAEYLAQTLQAKLILTGRSPFPQPDEWDRWLQAHDEADETAIKINRLRRMEAAGAQVIVMQADVASLSDMSAVMKCIDLNFQQLNGVIHAAGITDIDSSVIISQLGEAETQLHFQPKVYGLYVLQEVLSGREIDFCLLTSSFISVLGGVGLSAYTAASNFMDAFSYHMNHRGLPWISLNWEGASPKDSNDAFHRLMFLKPLPQLTVSQIDLSARLAARNKAAGNKKIDQTNQDKPLDATAAATYKRPDLTSTFVAPRNQLEEQLANMWQSFFGIQSVGIEDDFIELGGDSLKAITIISKIHQEYHVKLSLADFFKRPFIKDIALAVQEAEEDRYIAITTAPVSQYYPLSSAQRRLFILHQLDPHSTGYNETALYRLTGDFDLNQFEQSIKQMVQRHEILRSSITFHQGEPFQLVHDDIECSLQVIEAGDSPVEDLIRSSVKPFNLDNPPFFRIFVIKLSHNSCVLIRDMHHIIMDGVSAAIFMKELMALYAQKELPPLTIQYKDYAYWQNSAQTRQLIAKQEQYWLAEFAEELPLMQLPTDFPRPSIQSYQGQSTPFKIGEGLTKALKQMARKEDVTLYMLLLAAFSVLLAKLGGQEDLAIGTPIAGRRHADLQGLMGVFVNTLVMRNKPKADKTFKQFLNEVRERTLKAFENQDYQFEELVEKAGVRRDTSRNPLFDVQFVVQNFTVQGQDLPETSINNIELSTYSYDLKTAKFDLRLDVFDSGDSLTGFYEFCTKLFKLETIQRIDAYFNQLLVSLNKAPQAPLCQLEIIPASERRLLLEDFNRTDANYPRDKTIHRLFQEQAHRTPHRLALSGAGNSGADMCLSYSQLNESANRLAHEIRESCYGTGVIVAIMTHRSIEMIIGIMAILKAGAAYLPIDPGNPATRVAYILSDSQAALLITRRTILSENPIQIDIPVLDLDKLNVDLPDDQEKAAACDDFNHDSATDPAYVIYTSGSTGKPKGVIIEHYSVINRLNWMQSRYPLGADDVILQKTAFTFDVSVWELFWWSFFGASLHLLAFKGEMDPRIIADTIASNHITTMHFVPSMFNFFLEYLERNGGVERLHPLRHVFTSGEALGPHHVQRFYKLHKDTLLVNLYGPTEATVDVTYYDCHPYDSTINEANFGIPIGKPIHNIQLSIVDRRGEVQPIGVAGELCISGDGIARGYLNRPQLTAQQFIYCPNRTNQTIRFYKTGDLTCWLPDGNIRFFGRIDHQVKIRGFRVELGEIENLLANHPGINEVILMARVVVDSENSLCAYYVPVPGEDGDALNVTLLRQYLADSLPEYMIPSYFISMQVMPLTGSGKVDRKALPLPGAAIDTGKTYVEPSGDLENTIAGIWKEVLKLDDLGVTDGFFELGGTSLKLIQVNYKLKELLNREIPIINLFRYTTIQAQAEYLNQVDEGVEEKLQVKDREKAETRGKDRMKGFKNRSRKETRN